MHDKAVRIFQMQTFPLKKERKGYAYVSLNEENRIHQASLQF